MPRITLAVTAALVLLAQIAAFGAAPGVPEAIVPECFGVNIHFAGDQDTQVKMIAEAGFRLIRMDFNWEATEKEKGVYDFSQYDGLMAALDRYGVRALLILDYSNAIYTGTSDWRVAPANDEQRAAFARWAGAAAGHFRGRGIMWEIWNEPNGAFCIPPSAQNYALLLKAAAKAIKKADPSSLILGPATAGVDLGYIDAVLREGGIDALDIITVHPYRGGHMGPETAILDYKSVSDLASRYSPKGKKIVVASGEWGYTMAQMDAERQAQFLVRMMITNLVAGAAFSIWYDWSDDGTDPNNGEHNFGAIYHDLTPKPAYKAMQVLTSQLAGYRLEGRIWTGDPDDFLVVFENNGRLKLAAWTTANAHEVSVPVDVPAATVCDMYGKRSVADIRDGMLRLPLSGYVSYVDIPGRSTALALQAALQLEAEPAQDPLSGIRTVKVQVKNPTGNPIRADVIIRDPSSEQAPARLTLSPAPGKTAVGSVNVGMVWDGTSEVRVNCEASITGIEKPLTRTVRLDPAGLLTVSLAPSADGGNVLLFANPSGAEFSGAVEISGGGLASPAKVPVKLEKAQSITEVKCPVELPRAACDVRVTNAQGRPVYSASGLRYEMIDPFDDAAKYDLVMEGDGGVPGNVTISTADAPEKLGDVARCVKVDYAFQNGWRFARLAPKAHTPVNGKPRMVGLWVYGDGGKKGLSMRLVDSTGQTFQAALPAIDFKGWKLMYWSLASSHTAHWGGAGNGIVHWPLSWNTKLIVDALQTEGKGTIYIGPMWMMY